MRGYKKVRVIGKGSFGTAVLCTNRATGAEVVIKMIDLSDMPPKEREGAQLAQRVARVEPGGGQVHGRENGPLLADLDGLAFFGL